MAIEVKYTKTLEDIQALGSALTIEGLVLDDVEAFIDWTAEKGAAPARREAWVTKGRVMNFALGLTGVNAYPSDLNIVSLPLENFERPTALVTARFEIGARWLDDVTGNALDRQAEIDEAEAMEA